MKLHEIARPKENTLTVSVEPAGGIYGVFKVIAYYETEPASSTQHVVGDASTREQHTGSLTVYKVELAQDVDLQDDDDKPVADQNYKKGSDARKLPGWDKSDDEYVYDEVMGEQD